MRKPRGYEEAMVLREYEKLELGGHVCVIKKVEETLSSTNKDMIRIYLDIAEGPQKDYYADQYRNDTRDQKKWGCIVNQVTEDKNGNTSPGFKTFIDAVEKSNPGFDQNRIWDEKFCGYFTGKLVGGVFGREQYENKSTGELKWATKCVKFRDVETVRKGVEIPADKYLKNTGSPSPFPGGNGFSAVEDDEDLPF